MATAFLTLLVWLFGRMKATTMHVLRARQTHGFSGTYFLIFTRWTREHLLTRCRDNVRFSSVTFGYFGTGCQKKKGVGVEVGVGVSFIYMSFFLSFNANSDFSQFAPVVCCYNIFRYKENKKNVVEPIFRIIRNSRVTYKSRQSNDFCNRSS